MILRLLNVQGIAGIAARLALAILLVIQKGETRHWRRRAPASSSSTAQSRPLSPAPSPMTAPPPTAARAADQANADRVAAEQRAINERTADDLKPALPLLALLLSACASQRRKPQPIPVLAEARQCPAYPLPPAALLKPPVKTDFLDPTR